MLAPEPGLDPELLPAFSLDELPFDVDDPDELEEPEESDEDEDEESDEEDVDEDEESVDFEPDDEEPFFDPRLSVL